MYTNRYKTSNKGARWSKLKANLESLFADDLNLQIYCTANKPLASYWFSLNGEKIWDFPKENQEQWEMLWQSFASKGIGGTKGGWYNDSHRSLVISNLFREYIDTPTKELLNKKFEQDVVNITDILKAADRRLGKKKLLSIRSSLSETAQMIIEKRFNNESLS